MQYHQHKFNKSDKEGYEKCECGTYHSIAQGEPKEIYVDKDYWDHDTNHSTWDEQISNLTETETCGVSKLNKVLNYLPQRKPVLEIACSPGIMLKALLENGYETVGVEPNSNYNNDLWHQNPHTKIINGFFPECTKGLPPESFDYIIGMDVVEHLPDYEAAIFEAYRLLATDGLFLFMSPIITEEHGDVRSRDYLPHEHIWILSEECLRPFLSRFFKEVTFDFWQPGHNLIVCKK